MHALTSKHNKTPKFLRTADYTLSRVALTTSSTPCIRQLNLPLLITAEPLYNRHKIFFAAI